MPRQLRLPLAATTPIRREGFVIGPSNAQAVAVLDAWPRWPGGALALIGPTGVGKSYLAAVWAKQTAALTIDRAAPDLAAAAAHVGPILIEDADQGLDDEALFHLLNLAARPERGLLVTGRTAPATWPAGLPDLRSRLNALPVAEIDEPDDEVLRGVLEILFRERSIRPSDDLYPYLLRRMSRSIPEAREIVRKLDEGVDQETRPVSRALARQILTDQDQILDHSEE